MKTQENLGPGPYHPGVQRLESGNTDPESIQCLFLHSVLFTIIVSIVSACAPPDGSIARAPVDLRPPQLLAAGASSSSSFYARFDEPVLLVKDSLGLEPDLPMSGVTEGSDLHIEFGAPQSPGCDYTIVGEVDDVRGNRTRFLIRFVGWNDRPPLMRISEVQSGKNSSKSNPHRDYIELEVLSDGNTGGEELVWSSSVKTASYRFPGIEVSKGDFIVLHLAPEGFETEIDELGADTAVSGGVDATFGGRDLWCKAGPLPDENGAIGLRRRPGEGFIDGFFYADRDKFGELGANKLSTLVAELAASGAWPLGGGAPAWSDAFLWNPSTARSICRFDSAVGPQSWYVTSAGGQSPGCVNPSP
jgi:hypothetical protein